MTIAWQPDWKQVVGEMRDQAKSTLTDDLGNALTHGFKGFFNTILQQFEQMLAQMAAKAVVSGLFNMLGLGGGAGGGLLGGVMSAFGFDDGGNDRMAHSWGVDFAANFSRGIHDHQSQRQPMQESGHAGQRGGGMVVNMYGDHHYHGDMDARRVADTISWHAQNRLVVARAPKG